MPPTPRLPLLRPRRHDGPEPSSGAWISGVCAGLAAHLGISVRVVRLLFFLSLPTVLGPLFYLWLWIFVPRGNPWDATITDVRTSRLANLNATPTASTPTLKLSPAMLWALLLLCLALLAAWIGPDLVSTSLSVTVPLIVLAGVGLIWTGATGPSGSCASGVSCSLPSLGRYWCWVGWCCGFPTASPGSMRYAGAC